jgi:hypothetical protein
MSKTPRWRKFGEALTYKFGAGSSGHLAGLGIEVGDAEQEQRVGDLLLDSVVLPHERRRGLGRHGELHYGAAVRMLSEVRKGMACLVRTGFCTR